MSQNFLFSAVSVASKYKTADSGVFGVIFVADAPIRNVFLR